MCMGILPVHMPVHHIYVLCLSLVTPEVRRECQILLELELKIVENCLVVVGYLTSILNIELSPCPSLSQQQKSKL